MTKVLSAKHLVVDGVNYYLTPTPYSNMHTITLDNSVSAGWSTFYDNWYDYLPKISLYDWKTSKSLASNPSALLAYRYYSEVNPEHFI